MKLIGIKLLIVLIFISSSLISQEKKQLKLTLTDALNLAEKQSHQIQIARSQLGDVKGQDLESWVDFSLK